MALRESSSGTPSKRKWNRMYRRGAQGISKTTLHRFQDTINIRKWRWNRVNKSCTMAFSFFFLVCSNQFLILLNNVIVFWVWTENKKRIGSRVWQLYGSLEEIIWLTLAVTQGIPLLISCNRMPVKDIIGFLFNLLYASPSHRLQKITRRERFFLESYNSFC